MIFNLMAGLSWLLFSVLRRLHKLMSAVFVSKKAQIFFEERSPAHFDTILTEAKNELEKKRTNRSPVVYWLHVASAGELEQVIPILRALNERHSILFFLTYFSPSAKAFVKNCPGLLAATSLPLEDPDSYSRIIKKLEIRRLLLVRYDFWPLLIKTAERHNLPFSVLAATLARARSVLPETIITKLKVTWFKRAEFIFLVSKTDREKLAQMNFPMDKVYVSGDAKWHRAKERAMRTIEKMTATSASETLVDVISQHRDVAQQKLIIFGSPHEEELSVLQRSLESFLHDELIVVAPSEVDEKTVEKINARLLSAGAITFKLSQQSAGSLSAALALNQSKKVFILDSFGWLADLYRCADLAIVGGGFDGQLHNVLEPAAYPTLTLFGNRATRAPEAHQLLEHKAALGFGNPDELFQFLLQWSTLKGWEEKSPTAPQNLGEILNNARLLFGSLPDTSEVVCRALAQQDRPETT